MRYRVPRQAVRDGIVYVTEDRKIEGFFETMSIAENIYIGAAGDRREAVHDVSAWRRCARWPRQWIDTLNIRAINGNARVIELPAAISRRW